ncbi:MAG TPA: chromosome segregation protein SMC [Candidatus Binataceae bacterium]
MHLKTLEVVGFKSFLEHTQIGFAPGSTAVVGPNGCGKSNIVDAIRWVLGEQAPTRLRGKSTEDLIYAGNDKNPAAGMAEVSLILEGDEHSGLPEPYAALSEVCVTRRVFRSGDAEYLLNKIPCRLKDITELFLASQVHSRGYAIIEQGKIEEIIHAKPGDLRSLVEEAAGLSLFKGRREMSERKLERVKENLDRLNDVLSEIERQLGYARRQAKKAETYKILRGEADLLERLSAARRLLAERAELEQQSSRVVELRERTDTARHRQVELRAAFEQTCAAEQAERARLAAALSELENIRAAAAQRAQTREFIERRLPALENLDPSLEQRIAETRERATAARAQRAEMAARLARETNAGAGLERDLSQMRRSHEAAVAHLNREEKRGEEIKDHISDLMREAAVIQGRLGDLAGEREELGQRLHSEGAEEAEAEQRIATAREGLAEAQSAFEEFRARIAEQERAQSASAETELEARASVDRVNAAIKNARDTLQAAINRVERLRRSAAGERLRVVMESLNGDGPDRPPRFVQEVITAPRELEPALRAVLGEQLSTVIVDSPAFALRAIEILKETRSGRLSFISESADAHSASAASQPGISGRLVDMIGVRDGFRPVVEAMLGQVLLADSLTAAMVAANNNGHGTVYVTREGDVIWPGSMISGGSIGEMSSEIDDHPLSVEEAQAALEQHQAEHQAAVAHLEDCRGKRDRANSEMAAMRNEAARAEHLVSERRAEMARIERNNVVAQARREGARRRLAEIEAQVPAANARLGELAIEERSAREQLAAFKAGLDEEKIQAETLGARMLQLASEVESRKASLKGLGQELHQVSLRAEELESQIQRDCEALAQARKERTEFAAELLRLAEQDEAAGVRESELAVAAQERRAQCDELARQLADQREGVGAAGVELEGLEQELVDCGLRHERAATLCQELSHSFVERFHVGFEEVREELSQSLEGRDGGADDARLAELRSKLERIGEVNLAAESEVAELEARASELGAQREDLDKAMRDLSQTVQKLNREARKRFAETFEAAARNFSEVFPKLLPGGRGHLELVNSEELLESGVNILIQPAGKKVKDISLLSGGEKALSALALVFSLFLLNPSPFCLLDEVDAPLDEFSVAAFTGLVRELKGRSQFIIITHNQRTMQTADQIHGVTMDQPGVSRIISLKLPEAA